MKSGLLVMLVLAIGSLILLGFGRMVSRDKQESKWGYAFMAVVVASMAGAMMYMSYRETGTFRIDLAPGDRADSYRRR